MDTKQNISDYGDTVSAVDAVAFTDDLLPRGPEETEREISPRGNALWKYRKEGTINGIPVAPGDRDLPITRESYLHTAFELKTVPRSSVFWLSPEETESIDKYDELLARAGNHEIMIVDETKQYDAAKGKFMVWIRYNEVLYALHPRFDSLREELDHE